MVLNCVQKVSKQIVYSFNENSDSVNYEKDFEKISFPTQKLEIVLYDFIYIPTLNLSKSFFTLYKIPMGYVYRSIDSFSSVGAHLIAAGSLCQFYCYSCYYFFCGALFNFGGIMSFYF